ncbi:tRNA 2'-phosphotransferase 1 [Venturia nashicola]|uniref:2'-phosphotransferase n=1 Tax=Venturia nashicola TaxID=86259 RepID=A0A4Z1PA73_9PEZI|nr:tRNA 2'-phosphotransferase 1 [Venturia nashicola]TLD36525.1 tRNA 2'-phosphotransferase 1 [Venturia nashicola]
MARGGGGGGRGPMTREVQVSKKMSWLLRHGAEKEGLVLGSGGYMSVHDVLQNRNLKSLKVTFAELRSIVESNDKQRFSMIPKSEVPTDLTGAPVTAEASATPIAFEMDNDDASNFLIRANQGHSIKVEEEGLLEPITLDLELPSVVVHGTSHKAWPQIVSCGGLKRMTRNHVHFASGLPAGFEILEGANDTSSEARKEPVISGMRNTSAVLIFIDIKKALEGGLKFWKSANGVILSEGNESGLVPLAYFARVEERKRGVGVLVKDGEVVNELPEALTRGGDGGRRGGRGGRK